MMTHRERMDKGLVYDPFDEEVAKFQQDCMELLYDFNLTRPHELEKRQTLLKQMFGKIGENCYIEPPFHSNFGGRHVFMGNNVYANYNLTLVDDGNIYIGDNVMFAPNVVVATAGHPIIPELRMKGLRFNKDVHIGKNVWVGAGAILMPGVKIGDNTVIGAGSVVTKDIPGNVVAVGNPCRVIRPIGEKDKLYFYKDEVIDWENL
ncbi:sugar O-acetyltransferase [uncultured Solobacterium sp.]|uniref:sugar O-acetyltransferase n=1 Tax=uncultured Solobacterium sp. TaxID=747375 RepID=UPI0028DC4658|nr:sugar O-acetyltransferase [uncultured Solobacterium sp.]